MTTYRNGYEPEHGWPPAGDQPSLFDSDLLGLVHTHPPDPETSSLAAERIVPRLNQIQARVLDLLGTHGPMTDEELHAAYVQAYGAIAYSTARTRRGELRNQGRVVDTGERRVLPTTGSTAVVWRLVPVSLK